MGHESQRRGGMPWIFATGTLGAASFLFAPLIVGALAATSRWTPAVAAMTLSIELCGAALGSLVMMLQSPRQLLRPGLLALASLNIGSSLVLHFAPGDVAMLGGLRALCGVSEGFILGAVYVAIGSGPDPDRRFGLFLATTLFTAALGFWVLPLLISVVGLAGIFALVALAALLLLPGARSCMPASREVAKGRQHRLSAPLLALAAILLFFCGQGVTWTFAEQIGQAADLTTETVGLALGLASLAGLAGALAAAQQADRFGRRVPIIAGGLIATMLVVLLNSDIDGLTYFAVVCGLQLSWCYSVPYFLGGLAALAEDERLMSLGVFTQLAGLGLGPMAAAMLLDHGLGVVRILAAVFGLVAIVLATLAFREHILSGERRT